MFPGCPSVCPSVRCPLTPILRDAMPLHLVEEFEWNLAEILIMLVRIAEKVFKVGSQQVIV